MHNRQRSYVTWCVAGNPDEVRGDENGGHEADQPESQVQAVPGEVLGDPEQHVQVLVLPEVLETAEPWLELVVVVFCQRGLVALQQVTG